MTSINQILYGPPGTGKTYHTAQRAVEICNGQAGEDRENIMVEYKKLVEEGKVAFVTFHQSYGYEEFVEGLKPKLDKKDQNQEDISQSGDSGEVSYHIPSGVFKEICDKAREFSDDNYVIIIDEINRGNIRKIFGELITLIEDDKREGETNAISVTLPYSKQPFSVPKNVYIIGTMNTADRSLAQLDTALRRRFHFEPMMPKPEVLNGINIKGIEIKKMLTTINKRIEVLYDREHTIGHTFFTKLLYINHEDEGFDELKLIFRNKIIPLLEEYFFDDWHKIRLVLGDNQKEEGYQFIHEVDNNGNRAILFGDNESELDLPKSYSINPDAFNKEDSFIGIY